MALRPFLVAFACITIGCAGHRARSLPANPPDSTLFEAVVRSARGAAKYQRIRVYPWPIRGGEYDTAPSTEDRVTVSSGTLAANRAVLARLHIPAIDSVSFKDCSLGLDDDKSKCPKKGYTMITIGQPRDAATYRDEADHVSTDTLRTGQITMRVLFTELEHDGAAIVAREFRMHHEGTKWVTDSIQNIFYTN